MTPSIHLLHLAAVGLLVLTPGLTMLMSVNSAALHGTARALVCTAGCAGRASLYLQGWPVGASNPKAVLFFSAFFPQFIEAQGRFMRQFALLALTFVLVQCPVLGLCCIFAARFGPRLRRPGRAHWYQRLCGGPFVRMGAMLLLRRPT